MFDQNIVMKIMGDLVIKCNQLFSMYGTVGEPNFYTIFLTGLSWHDFYVYIM